MLRAEISCSKRKHSILKIVIKGIIIFVLMYYHNLSASLYETKHLVANSACTTQKIGEPTCQVINRVGDC
ncbi:hypothetical protein TNCV_873141 [Trichonephila clavipes]|nr:hypothetical protein TNCV_873141 [Trichonephila clavipes]